eukprot:5177947-Heterocapsa_arctica.AAC.1
MCVESWAFSRAGLELEASGPALAPERARARSCPSRGIYEAIHNATYSIIYNSFDNYDMLYD